MPIKIRCFEQQSLKFIPKKNERSQTFKIEAKFKDVPKQLYPGLSGEANILIHEKEKALVIPRICLLDGNKVETLNGTIEVTTGLENLEYIEILSGLSEEDEVYYPVD